MRNWKSWEDLDRFSFTCLPEKLESSEGDAWYTSLQPTVPPLNPPQASGPAFQPPVSGTPSDYLAPVPNTVWVSANQNRAERQEGAAFPAALPSAPVSLGLICKMSLWPKWSPRSPPTLAFCALSVSAPDLGGLSHHGFLPPSLQSYMCTIPISWVIVPEYKLIPN